MPGHDPLAIRSAHVLADGRTLFLEIPDLQPVNQLHLHLQARRRPAARPLRDGPQARPRRSPASPATAPTPKTIAAHPILADMVALATKPVPNPWPRPIPGARPITIEAGKNLTFSARSFTVQRRRADQAHASPTPTSSRTTGP